MAAEEDKQFDAVVGGFLVNDLRGRAERLHCPAPDVLAAYHERSLLPGEMNSWKEHIVGCVNCQAILAELEATDSIPLQFAEREEILVMEPTAAVDGVAVVAGQGRSAPRAASQEKSRVSRFSRGVRWHWFAPVGALAAGLLVWIGWYENRHQALPSLKQEKIARVEPSSSSSPPLPSINGRPAGAPSADEIASLSRDAERRIAREKPATSTLKQQNEAFAKAAPRKLRADKETRAREEAERDKTAADSLMAANGAQGQPSLDAKTAVGGVASQAVEVQAPTANIQTLDQQNIQNQQNQANAQKVHGPSAVGQAELSKKAKSGTSARLYGAPAAPPPAPAGPAPAIRALQTAALTNSHLIPAPGAKILWRAGPAGLIAFSSDGGASWSRQPSNVFADLTAGSAPSDKVCWIVGRAGIILLTTNAGAQWTSVRSPFDEDLGGIRAVDALHATIWNSSRTKAFETSDGGVTWKPAPPQ